MSPHATLALSAGEAGEAGAAGHRLRFELPHELEASEPPEARGAHPRRRPPDGGPRSTGTLVHSTFTLLPAFLDPGDLVVVNTSGTMPAAVDATTDGGERLVVHLSTAARRRTRWVVEPRRLAGRATERWHGEPPPRHLSLAGGRGARPRRALPRQRTGSGWPTCDLPQPVLTWLAVHGRPIRYRYVERPWPLVRLPERVRHRAGQRRDAERGPTVHPRASSPGSSPRAWASPRWCCTPAWRRSRPTSCPTPSGCGCPRATAERVNAAHAAGGRVVAVGTTVVRALETRRRRRRPSAARSTAGPTSS